MEVGRIYRILLYIQGFIVKMTCREILKKTKGGVHVFSSAILLLKEICFTVGDLVHSSFVQRKSASWMDVRSSARGVYAGSR